MNTRKVESNKSTGEFGNTPVAQVIFVLAAILLAISVSMNVVSSNTEPVMDVRSLGYVEVGVGEVSFTCLRHIGPSNEISPCPEDWVRYRQVHVMSEVEQREIEAARVTLATRRD